MGTKVYWLAAVGSFAASVVWADVRLPALIGDGMVLQRDSKVPIWGWARPSEEVRIDFQGRQFRTRTSRNGRWSMALGPYSGGGPHEMLITGKNVLVLSDILIGDVWLASGQSNMVYPLKDGRHAIVDADREVAQARFPHIRLLSVEYAGTDAQAGCHLQGVARGYP